MEEKISDRIYCELRKDIIDGKYQPREFISESQIAKLYDVSKAPVKEAMHNLVEQGYLIGYPRKGYMVNSYSNDEINQIQEIRRNLESMCVSLAIKNASNEEIEKIRDYINGDKNNMDPRDTINSHFHLNLARLSGNKFMEEVLRNLVHRASMARIKDDPDVANFNHIIDAMLDRNEEEALKWLIIDIRML